MFDKLFELAKKRNIEALELYVYDIVDVNKTFEERLEIINNFAKELNLSFSPEKEWNEGDPFP